MTEKTAAARGAADAPGATSTAPPARPHPVEALFSAIDAVRPYPDGVTAVPARVAGVAVFPGGAGLWGADRGAPLPPMPIHGVMILGQDFRSRTGYDRSRARGGESLSSPTWRELLPLLDRAGIAPAQCFFTNAYIGLRTGARSTGRFPGARDAAFVTRCREFLATQLAAQRPQLVVTLGVFAPRVLGPLSPDLASWLDAPKLRPLDDAGCSVVVAARFPAAALVATVVALTHPSQRRLKVSRRRYRGAEGDDAERLMLEDAAAAAGLRAAAR